MEEVTERVGIIESWLRKHRHIYNGATRHPFILSIRDGSVNSSSFQKWLGQDYIFVRALVPFVASTLVKACKQSGGNSDMELILSGLVSLSDELEWFKNQASKLNVSLTSVVPENANLNYCGFVESLMSGEVEYAVAMAAYWAIEAVYQESFAHCLEAGYKTPVELIETCQRWGNEDFGNYCKALAGVAERCLENAPAQVVSRAEIAFLQVLEHEIEFWNMSR